MTPQELDVIVRVAGATLLIWAAIRQRSDGRSYFVAVAICLCGFLAGNTPDPALRLSGPLGSLAVLLAGYVAVFLWWYCLAVFDAGFRPRGPVLAVSVIWIVVASADRGLLGPSIAEMGLSWGLIGLGLVMVGHLAWRLLRDRPGDLIDRRRQARVMIVVLLAGQLLADLCVDLLLGFDWQPHAFSIVQNGALLAFVAWLLSLDPTKASSTARDRGRSDVRPSTASSADPVLAARLNRIMEVERIHLDPDLSFNDFVRAMGGSERSVRRLINQQLGYDHFRTFLNAWRVKEARRLLADPIRSRDKLVAIAFDSGFASLPSFNRVFREVEGRTPSAFREAAPVETDPEPASEERQAGF